MSSTPESRRCRLATIFGSKEESRSRGTSSSTGPASVNTFLVRLPLRELPLPLPAGSLLPYPRWSSISPSSADSTTSLVSFDSNPPSPVNCSPSARACSTSSLSRASLIPG